MDETGKILDHLKCPCCGKEEVDTLLPAMVLDLQKAMGRPLTITSGYRCQKHNQELIDKGLPAAKNSMHCKGKAIDVLIIDPQDKEKLIGMAKRIGFKGIGRGKTFVHLDLGEAREWIY
jgi:zinc D-Ala-D-Ala carboxypeptidase